MGTGEGCEVSGRGVGLESDYCDRRDSCEHSVAAVERMGSVGGRGMGELEEEED